MSASVRARELLSRLPEGPIEGVEIGVWRGAMSAELLKRPELSLWMVDSWAEPESQPAHYRETDDFHAVATARQHSEWEAEALAAVGFAGSRAVVLHLPSVEAAAACRNEMFDFVFIDADHSYEGTRADIEAWLPKIKPGGLLSGHDYHPEKNARKGFGVCRAVDEAVELHGWTLELGANDTWFVRLPG